MNTINWLFFLLISIGMIQSPKNDHPIFSKHSAIIDKATEIAVYEIQKTPVEAASQDSDKKYVQNYEVIRHLEPLKDAEGLKKAVLDKHNYLKDQKKKCPLQGNYALTFTQKEQYITLVVSDTECPKVIVFSSEKEINNQYYDLQSENGIQSLLVKLAKN